MFSRGLFRRVALIQRHEKLCLHDRRIWSATWLCLPFLKLWVWRSLWKTCKRCSHCIAWAIGKICFLAWRWMVVMWWLQADASEWEQTGYVIGLPPKAGNTAMYIGPVGTISTTSACTVTSSWASAMPWPTPYFSKKFSQSIPCKASRFCGCWLWKWWKQQRGKLLTQDPGLSVWSIHAWSNPTCHLW